MPQDERKGREGKKTPGGILSSFLGHLRDLLTEEEPMVNVIPNVVLLDDRDRTRENLERINRQYENPETWVRRALVDDRGPLELLQGDYPQGVMSETEWDILRYHVLHNFSYMAISKTILREPEARIRQFAEDAARKLVPARAQAAQLAMMSPEVMAEMDQSRVDLDRSLRDLYQGVGMPFGDTPEGLARYVQVISRNEAAIQALRKVAEDNVLVSS